MENSIQSCLLVAEPGPMLAPFGFFDACTLCLSEFRGRQPSGFF
jgi:hypothetical protein